MLKLNDEEHGDDVECPVQDKLTRAVSYLAELQQEDDEEVEYASEDDVEVNY